MAKTFSEILKSYRSTAATFNEIKKFNPYHDRLGRFTTSGGGSIVSGTSGGGSTAIGSQSSLKSNRSYGSTDLTDAITEISGGSENSLSKYIDKNGKLSPEREAVHKKIIDDILEGKTPVSGQAEMRMMGGGPASGKSSVIESGAVRNFDEKSSVTIDPDFIKTKLPGYSEMANKTDKAASYYHEESSAIAKRLANVSFNENYNVTYDGTGDGSERSVLKKIDSARKNGYKVTATYVTVDTEEAVARNEARYQHGLAKGENPRKVPEEYVRSCHRKVTDISIKCADKFDSIELYDNNGPRGSAPVLIAKGGNGKKLTAVPGQEDAFAAYVAKGSK